MMDVSTFLTPLLCNLLYHSTLATFLLWHLYSVSSVYHLGDVDCRGNESMLSDCNHGGIGVQSCFRSYAAGVICNCELLHDVT